MEIEVGRFYKLRNGRLVYIAGRVPELWAGRTDYPFIGYHENGTGYIDKESWTATGKFLNDRESEWDLVELAPTQSEPTQPEPKGVSAALIDQEMAALSGRIESLTRRMDSQEAETRRIEQECAANFLELRSVLSPLVPLAKTVSYLTGDQKK